jgi:hypothetical protein
MPYYLFIYSPSDFVTTLPAENSSGNFSGTLPYTMTLRPGATPTRVEVTDNDINFHEVDPDGQQVLTKAIMLGGTAYPAGATVNSAYDLFSTTHALRVTTLHFGGDGYFAGPVHGLVSNQPLTPGQSYTFDQTVTSNSTPVPYESLACFAAGTRIATLMGEIAVQDLQPGDPVMTLDNAYQPLLRVMSTTVPATGAFAPVIVPAGLIGNLKDLVLSPQHRVLFTGPRAELLFGEAEVLVAAIHLAEAGIARRRNGGEVTYYHLVFEQHEIIFAEGAPAESFLPGEARDLPLAAQQEFAELFPGAARLCLRAHEAALLLDTGALQIAA